MERLRQEEEALRELTFSPQLRRSSYDVSSRISVPRPRSNSVNMKGNDLALLANIERPRSGASLTGSTSSEPTTPKLLKRKKNFKITRAKEVTSSLLDSIKSELKSAAQKAAESDKKAAEIAEKVAESAEPALSEEEQVAPFVETILLLSEEPEALNIVETEIETLPTFIFKYDASSTDTKGRLKLREAANYELNSMYRKRDKYAGRDGISLQMGRHEETHSEEVLSVFFDKEKMSEQEAGEWWILNQSRF